MGSLVWSIVILGEIDGRSAALKLNEFVTHTFRRAASEVDSLSCLSLNNLASTLVLLLLQLAVSFHTKMHLRLGWLTLICESLSCARR